MMMILFRERNNRKSPPFPHPTSPWDVFTPWKLSGVPVGRKLLGVPLRPKSSGENSGASSLPSGPFVFLCSNRPCKALDPNGSYAVDVCRLLKPQLLTTHRKPHEKMCAEATRIQYVAPPTSVRTLSLNQRVCLRSVAVALGWLSWV